MSGLVLDSGAYSLNTRGYDSYRFSIEADRLTSRYMAYLLVAQEEYDFVIAMDDRFDPNSLEHNIGRIRAMEKEGICSVPVLHNLQDSEVSYWIDQGYSCVAIGQVQVLGVESRKNYNHLFKVVKKFYRNNVKVHLLGMTDIDLIMNVPAYSCDSASWAIHTSVGVVRYWNPANIGDDKTDKIYFPRHQMEKPRGSAIPYYDYPYLADFKEYIHQCLGMDWYDLFTKKTGYSCKQLINILYYMDLEREATKYHEKEMGVKFDF
jgi:hypothetical protein